MRTLAEYVDIALSAIFIFFVIIHVGLFLTISVTAFIPWCSTNSGAEINDEDAKRNRNVRKICIGGAPSSSGLDFESISSLHDSHL